jgi:hypothetical protein
MRWWPMPSWPLIDQVVPFVLTDVAWLDAA